MNLKEDKIAFEQFRVALASGEPIMLPSHREVTSETISNVRWAEKPLVGHMVKDIEGTFTIASEGADPSEFKVLMRVEIEFDFNGPVCGRLLWANVSRVPATFLDEVKSMIVGHVKRMGIVLPGVDWRTEKFLRQA